MKQAEVKIGGHYTARVSTRIVPVLVLREEHRPGHNYGYGGSLRVRASTRYAVRNLVTGREVTLGAGRLRAELSEPAAQELTRRLSADRPTYAEAMAETIRTTD